MSNLKFDKFAKILNICFTILGIGT